MSDWDSIDRILTQTGGRAFQILDQAFYFLLKLQKHSRVSEKLGLVFERLDRVF